MSVRSSLLEMLARRLGMGAEQDAAQPVLRQALASQAEQVPTLGIRSAAEERPTPSLREAVAQRAQQGNNVGQSLDASGFDTGNVAYRGLGRAYNPADGGYYQSFTSSLADAREYGSHVTAAHLRPGRNLAIDGGGNNFNSISVEQLPAAVRSKLHPSAGRAVTTDEIAHAAREAGYDSVTVRNVHDNRWGERPQSGQPTRTINFVFDTRNVRPLDHVPEQPSAAAPQGKVRLSDSDRALLAELEDGHSAGHASDWQARAREQGFNTPLVHTVRPNPETGEFPVFDRFDPARSHSSHDPGYWGEGTYTLPLPEDVSRFKEGGDLSYRGAGYTDSGVDMPLLGRIRRPFISREINRPVTDPLDFSQAAPWNTLDKKIYPYDQPPFMVWNELERAANRARTGARSAEELARINAQRRHIARSFTQALREAGYDSVINAREDTLPANWKPGDALDHRNEVVILNPTHNLRSRFDLARELSRDGHSTGQSRDALAALLAGGAGGGLTLRELLAQQYGMQQ